MSVVSLGPGRFLGRETGAITVGPVRVTETVYAAGEGLPPHAHEWPYLCFVLGGSYTEKSPSAVAECSSGILAYGPAGLPHSNTFGATGGTCLNLALDPAWLSDCPIDLPGRSAILYVDEPSTTFLAGQLRWELRTPDSLSLFAVEGLARVLVAKLGRGGSGPSGPSGPLWLDAAVAIATAEFRTPIGLGDIARRVGRHPNHLARAFRERTGRTVGEYVRERRVDAACRLLGDPGVPLATVARECGFADQSHLTRVFRRSTGQTPGAYRRLVSA